MTRGISTPNTFYKYMKRQHARQLVRSGICRIGTLFEYRDMEKYGPEIGDTTEGRRSIYFHGEMSADDPSTIPEFTKNVINLAGKGSAMINCEIVQEYKSEDMFVFSGSKEPDPRTMRAMGYETIVKIIDIESFVRAVTPYLHERCPVDLKHVLLGLCFYQQRTQHYLRDPGIHPALIKDPEYAYQKELRVIWSPANQPIEPLIVECAPASHFCRFVSDNELKDCSRRPRRANR